MTNYRKYYKDFTIGMLLSLLKNNFETFGKDAAAIRKKYPEDVIQTVMEERKVILEILLERCE